MATRKPKNGTARKPKSHKYPLFAVFWTDATKEDDAHSPGDITPENAVSYGYIIGDENGKVTDHIKLVGEVFADGHMRSTTAIPGRMIKKIVKVGYAPSIRSVFAK